MFLKTLLVLSLTVLTGSWALERREGSECPTRALDQDINCNNTAPFAREWVGCDIVRSDSWNADVAAGLDCVRDQFCDRLPPFHAVMALCEACLTECAPLSAAEKNSIRNTMSICTLSYTSWDAMEASSALEYARTFIPSTWQKAPVTVTLGGETHIIHPDSDSTSETAPIATSVTASASASSTGSNGSLTSVVTSRTNIGFIPLPTKNAAMHLPVSYHGAIFAFAAMLSFF
ncbi:uncharacterized protein GIQ15_02619 [Arthroderma uncinatum]|uniref:uncharacterized protein n=1 Tax=Arthroderma uncinatum TaxID=74035 RepID=UPI00144A9170|nr:uncharacterized protein GIQ15_02619 [Arthroderma uncinatum]KAF3483295.1 hypothetical protein GIQ15_02619 [Arthroderma uncinatum]